MSHNAKLGLIMIVALSVAVVSNSCERTCTQTSDCGFDSFCSEEGICASECENSGDCSFDETCSFGRCIRFAPPRIISITPEGGVIGPTTQIDVEISFLGPFAEVTLERSVGTPCIPFTTRQQIVENGVQDAVILVTFENVPALGRSFDYRLSVKNELGETTRQLSFQSNETALRSGLDVEENVLFPPNETFTIDDKASLNLNLSLEDGASVWAETFPEVGPGGGGRVVGSGNEIENAWVPLVPGASVLSLEFQREGQSTGCEVALQRENIAQTLDVSLSYLSADDEDPADLDLVLVLENDGQTSECSADAPTAECRVPALNRGSRRHDDEIISLVPEPRVIGVYVRSAHVSDNAFAIVNIVDRGITLTTTARTLSPARGDIWLVGRIFVQGDSVFEPLSLDPAEEIVREVPSGLPSTW